jgi:hypothetical protein
MDLEMPGTNPLGTGTLKTDRDISIPWPCPAYALDSERARIEFESLVATIRRVVAAPK